MAATVSRVPPRRRTIVLVSCLCGLAALAAASVLGDDAFHPPPAPRRVIPQDPRDGPLSGGRRITFERARTLPFPVFVLDAPSANRATLASVWVDHDNVAFVYGRNEVTLMMWPAPRGYGAEALRTVARASTAHTALLAIDGAPAVVFERDTDLDRSNPAWLELVRDGMDVNVFSDSLSAAELVRIATTLRPLSAGRD